MADFLMDEWLRLSETAWRRIWEEALEVKDYSRAKFARYMLSEVIGVELDKKPVGENKPARLL